MDNAELLELISNYQNAKLAFEMLKKDEARLRIELLSALFPNGSGSEKAEIGDLIIKGNFGYNIKLHAVELDAAFASLSEEEQNCIVFKPSLVMKNYNDLESSKRPLLDECISVSPAMPSLKIEAVKGEDE